MSTAQSPSPPPSEPSAQTEAPGRAKVLAIGFDPRRIPALASLVAQCELHVIPMDLNVLMEAALNRARGGSARLEPSLIICGEPVGTLSLGEIAQTVRMLYPDPPFYCIVNQRKLYNRGLHIKNGFTDSFLLPFETAPMKRILSAALRSVTQGAFKAYRSVRFEDLKPGTQLPFDLAIFLPMNARYVTFIGRGSELTPEHHQKLIHHQVDLVFVNMDDLPAFYEYAGKNSLTERRHRMEDEYRKLVANVLRGWEFATAAEGKKFVDECARIIQTCILDFPKEQLISQFTATMGDIEDPYAHALNVATYAALFSMALRKGDPLSLGLAGLLHDLGEIDLPAVFLAKTTAERTSAEEDLYRKHPEMSVRLIEELNLPVPGNAYRSILQHQERFDGSGYPAKADGTLVSAEAQILALADVFDYLTRLKPGQPAVGTEGLLAKARKELLPEDGRVPIDPGLARAALALFGSHR